MVYIATNKLTIFIAKKKKNYSIIVSYFYYNFNKVFSSIYL